MLRESFYYYINFYLVVVVINSCVFSNCSAIEQVCFVLFVPQSVVWLCSLI